jgi:hypothetical protein
MSRQEFAARQQRAARAGSYADVAGLVVLIGGLLLFVPAVRYLCTCYPPGRVYCSAGLAILCFLAANYLLAQWTLLRRARQYGLTCAHCGSSLLGARGAYVSATGYCRECEALIVSPAHPALA